MNGSRTFVDVPFSGVIGGPGLLPGIVLQNIPDAGRPSRGVAKVWLPHIHGPIQPLPTDLPEAVMLMLWGGIAQTGIITMPPVGSAVVCGFMLGDVESPVILGQFYGAEQLPAEALAANPPDSALTMQHPSGWVIKVDFLQAKMEITHPTQNAIVVDATGVKISKAGEEATARVIHEFGVDTFTGAPLGEATQGASAAVKVSQSPL